MEWISIQNEKEFRNIIGNGYVLAFNPHGVYRYMLARWDTGRGWTDLHGFAQNGITHFIPLPKPPEGEEK